MKPIYQWIADLPYEARKNAESNMFRFPLVDRNTLVNSLDDAILKGFIWGRGFGTIEEWNDIYLGKQKTLF